MARPGQTLLATMITTTTYGTWLPGDVRGFVEDGVVLPGDPELLKRSGELMRGEAVYLSAIDRDRVFEALQGVCAEYGYDLLSAAIESWHVHVLLNHGFDEVGDVVGRLKNRMRQAVGRGRIWTAGYDKRFCFSEADVESRRRYILRHKGCCWPVVE